MIVAVIAPVIVAVIAPVIVAVHVNLIATVILIETVDLSAMSEQDRTSLTLHRR